MAIEDAVNTRTRFGTGPTGEPAAPESTLEAQKTSSHSFSKVLPPKFVTPPTSRKVKSSEPFPASPPVDLDFAVIIESASIPKTSGEGGDKSNPQNRNPSPWKTTPADMESWSPRTRKRG